MESRAPTIVAACATSRVLRMAMGTRRFFQTLVQMQEEACTQFADRPLFSAKDARLQRITNATTYAQFGTYVSRCRAALASRAGVAAGDKVAVISNNRVEWAIGAYAAMGLGAAYVPMYEQQILEDWAFILQDSGAKAVLCSTDAIRQQIAALPESEGRTIVCFDPTDNPEHSFQEWLAGDHPGADRSTSVTADTLATLIYTSGTTGRPKGVMLSHQNICSNVHALKHRFGKNYGHETHLSFLPWAHCYGQTVELHMALHSGAHLGLAESVATLLEDIQDVQPTVLVSVPTLFNRVYDGIQNNVEKASPLRKGLFKAAMRVALWRRNLLDTQRTSVANRALYAAFDKLVYSKIRSKMGGRLRMCWTGGAQLDKTIQSFFDDIGILVLEGYGLTETSPLVATEHYGLTERLQRGLRAIDGVSVLICMPNGVTPLPAGEEGEVCVAGPNVMQGYHNLPEETAAAIFELTDGRRCFRTGDLGVLQSDGELLITGRLKEQYKLENGKYVAPGPVEDTVTLNRFISQCFITGDNAPYNVALVLPDRGACEEVLGDRVDTTNIKELIESQIRDEVAPRLHRSYEVPRRVYVMSPEEEFTIANGLLTPKMSKKRQPIREKYADVIASLYQ